MRPTRLIPLITLVSVLGVLTTGTLVAFAPTPPRGQKDHTRPITATFAAVGDSITAWTDRYTGEPRGELSWVNWTNSGRAVFVGGFARSAATSGNMLAEMSPGIPALQSADVKVIMAGTNDVTLAVPLDVSMSNIDAIVQSAGGGKVIVSAIAPSNANPVGAASYNAYLKHHAAQQGWMFVDPWVAVRQADGTYVPGANRDDLHPTGATQSIVGDALRAAILEDASG